MLELVPRRPARCGCSTSAAARDGSPPSCATAATTSPASTSIADEGIAERTDRFFEADVEHGLPDAVGDGYDVVIAADVIEHVRNPDVLLADLAGRMSNTGMIVASVPNFGHWYPRLRTAAGLFDYDQRGILDRTHVRFFTRRSFRRAVANTGLVTTSERYAGLPLDVLGVGGVRRARS